MKELNIEDVDFRSIIEIFDRYQIEELNIEEHGLTLEIKSDLPLEMRPPEPPVQYVSHEMPMVMPSAINTATPSPGVQTAPAEPENPAVPEGKYDEVLSPMVGNFYRSSSPEAGPFVREGSPVTPDTTVCIVEAMKMMNEIKAEVSGKVVKILVENGQPVQPGTVLFLVEPS